MTEHEIQQALYYNYSSSWELAATNIYTYRDSEADVAAILKGSGYYVEYEIKLTIHDFRADFSKTGKHYKLKAGNFLANRFYYVIPEHIAPLAMFDLPDYAGLIVVCPQIGTYFKHNPCFTKHKAPMLHRGKPPDWLLRKINVSNYHHNFRRRYARAD